MIYNLLMKNKIKKLKLPLNKMTENEKDYTAVLMEDMNSNVKAFWEVLSSVKEKGEATFEQMGLMTEKLGMVEAEQAITNKRLDSIEGQQEITNKRLDSIDFKLDDLINEISFIKEEIKALKTALSMKVDKEKLEILEFKIVRIEKSLNLS